MSESQPGDEPIINIEGPRVSLPEGDLPDPATLDLETLDPSDSRLFQNDAWRPWFERLRAEDPVHYTPDSPFGPYWSVTSHADIMQVESHHDVFSSFPTIVIGDSPNGQYIENFIAMDPPRHEQQRKTVAGVVAPHNLVTLEPVIRGHAAEILDGLPDGGETFDWVDSVSIELTTRMLATLFDFPFEDRRKLTYWSDISIVPPEKTGADQGHPAEEVQAGLQDLADTFMGLWAERAAADPTGRNDLITMLAHGEDTRDMATRPLEFLGNIMLLIVGGNDTTRNSISGGCSRSGITLRSGRSCRRITRSSRTWCPRSCAGKRPSSTCVDHSKLTTRFRVKPCARATRS